MQAIDKLDAVVTGIEHDKFKKDNSDTTLAIQKLLGYCVLSAVALQQSLLQRQSSAGRARAAICAPRLRPIVCCVLIQRVLAGPLRRQRRRDVQKYHFFLFSDRLIYATKVRNLCNLRNCAALLICGPHSLVTSSRWIACWS